MENFMLCDGDCDCVHNEKDLFKNCYNQRMCEDCIVIFMNNQEQEEVCDHITGER